jgi:hypothetical protein
VLRLDGQPWALNVLDATVPITATRKTLSARVYSPTAGIPIKIKLEAGAANTGDVAANETVVVGWQTLTWTFSNADPALTYNVVVLLPNIGTVDAAPGKTYYFDDIKLLAAATGGGGTVTATPDPTAAAGSAGPVTLPLLTASYLGDFGAVGNGVFAGDYIGGIDANGNHATWATGTSRGVASNGNIGYFQDNALSTSSQKLEENGWIAGLIDNAGGVPSFFRFFILTAPASTFTNSYMGLFVNAPNNGTVDVSSYGSIKFRAWGPAEMYQDPAFSPTLEMKLTGPKIAGCTATGSGATEIKKTFVDYPREEKILLALTVIAILATNLFTGVLIGLVVAIAKELYRLMHLKATLIQPNDRGIYTLKLSGAATFAHIPYLLSLMEEIKDKEEQHLH